MTAYGRHIVVTGGEPSSSPSDRNELSLAYVLDTSKIRYPASDALPNAQQPQSNTQPARKFSSAGDSPANAAGKGAVVGAAKQNVAPQQQQYGKNAEAPGTSAIPTPGGTRLPRVAGNGAPPGPPPQQKLPAPRSNSVAGSRSKTPTKSDRSAGPSLNTSRQGSVDTENISPITRDSPSTSAPSQNRLRDPTIIESKPARLAREGKESMDTTRSGSLSSRSGSRAQRQQQSIDSTDLGTPRPSVDNGSAISRDVESRLIDSGVGSSPALSQQNDELAKELEAARGRNAWLASELSLARKAGYQSTATGGSPILDEKSNEAINEADRPLVEALLKMRGELERVQGSIEAQAISAANRIAEIERQRDAAINEAAYAKAKLAAHGGGSQMGTPQPDGVRGTSSPDVERVNEMNKRLATSLASERELAAKVDSLTHELEAEKKAKQFNEETVDALQKRIAEHDSHRQRNALEMETLRMELHEAQKSAREEAASAQEARASQRLMAVDKRELETKFSRSMGDAKNHSSILASLREAVTASTNKASLLEAKVEEERRYRTVAEQKLGQLRADHELRTNELVSMSQRLRDAEELAEKHAAEARTHREAVLLGFGKVSDRDEDELNAVDERVTILQQQVEAANGLVRQHQVFADQAAGKVRSAEERIAGLEAYQEQTTRECLQIRKQLQSTMKEMQALQAEKAEIIVQYERHQLESNALEVQLRTLKNLLEERGVNAADHRRSRALDSPGSRFGTPELNRVRELEQQLEASLKAHDEMRSTFENREEEVNKEYEQKIKVLTDDHQAAVKYLKGTEKMLSKMKQELERYKSMSKKLEEDLSVERQRSQDSAATPSTWEVERDSLRKEINALQSNLKASVSELESRLVAVQSELATAKQARDAAHAQASTHETTAQRARAEAETLRQENAALEERTRDAENRVQLFLDQFETSVDNYRRQSHLSTATTTTIGAAPNGTKHTRGHDSISGDSVYSVDETGNSTPDANPNAAARNSMALDSLANELESLRTHWESTNKAYRLSDRFDFEKTPDLSKGLNDWTKPRRTNDDDDVSHGEMTPKKFLTERKSSLPTTS